MIDIGTSVALDAQRSGRTTRMTDQMARQEQRLKLLAATLADTRRRRMNAQAFVQEALDSEAYLQALIERERVNPTPVPDELAPAAEAPSTDPAPHTIPNGTPLTHDAASSSSPPEHDHGTALAGDKGGLSPELRSNSKSGAWPMEQRP
jgi:hypothetical protein